MVSIKVLAAVIPQVVGASLGGCIGGETELGLNQPVLFFAVSVTLLATLICGLPPALHVLGADLQPQMAGTGKGVNGTFRHGKLRSGLVVAEVSLSIVLLIGAGLMLRSFFLLTHVRLGFNPMNVLLVVFLPPPSQSMTPAVKRFVTQQGRVVLQEVAQRLKALPGVADVATEDTIPGYGPTQGPEVTVPGETHAEEVGLFACDENLLQTLELRLTHGAWLCLAS
jgi:putative ABC transport system permease protein